MDRFTKSSFVKLQRVRPCAGVRLYEVTIDDYVPSNPQKDRGTCDGWLRDAAVEREEGRAAVHALKSEL